MCDLQIVQLINDIVDEQCIIVDVQQALNHTHQRLYEKLLPSLQMFSNDATQYVVKRNERNVVLYQIMNDTVNEIEHIITSNNISAIVCPMSSICAQLNLIDESDIDIGILVDDLNTPAGSLNKQLFDDVYSLLLSSGYTFDHVFNEHVHYNRYYSFVKYVDGVEIEVKVRDHETSKIILKLHKKLDNDLTENERTLLTYAKSLVVSDKKTYKNLKKIIYCAIFSTIPGSYLL